MRGPEEGARTEAEPEFTAAQQEFIERMIATPLASSGSAPPTSGSTPSTAPGPSHTTASLTIGAGVSTHGSIGKSRQ